MLSLSSLIVPLLMCGTSSADEDSRRLVVEATIPYPAVRRSSDYDYTIAPGFGSVWTVSRPDLMRIDPTDNSVTSIKLEGVVGPVRHLGIGEGAVWVADSGSNTVFKIDPSSNAVKKISIEIGGAEGDSDSRLGLGAGSLWMVTGGTTLTRLNVETGAVEANVELPSASGGGVLFDFGFVWVVGSRSGEVYRVNPNTNSIEAVIPLHRTPYAAATGEGSIWVNSRRGGVVDRIDGPTGTVTASIETGLNGPDDIAVGGGYVWLATAGFGMTLTQIDPKTNAVVRKFKVQDLYPVAHVGFCAGSLWLFAPSSIYRIRVPD